MRWRIYYGDGSTFSDEDGTPEEAPTRNTQAILFGDTGNIVTKVDWYWWRPDEEDWYGGTLDGFLDQAMHCGAIWPKQGRSLQDDQYRAVILQVVEDKKKLVV